MIKNILALLHVYYIVTFIIYVSLLKTYKTKDIQFDCNDFFFKLDIYTPLKFKIYINIIRCTNAFVWYICVYMVIFSQVSGTGS